MPQAAPCVARLIIGGHTLRTVAPTRHWRFAKGNMDTQRFELLLRDTPFCSALLAEVWDGLSTMERIDLLLHSVESRLSLSKELKAKALSDPSPVIRMLAV